MNGWRLANKEEIATALAEQETVDKKRRKFEAERRKGLKAKSKLRGLLAGEVDPEEVE